MKYIEYKIIEITEQQSEIIVAELAEIGFDSFSEYDQSAKFIDCYILDEKEDLILTKKTLIGYTFHRSEIEQQNWNSMWESNFEPININDRCYIRATFHEPKNVDHEIVITPKMSFGTGHHPTTHLVTEMMLDEDFSGKTCLDMGSGTGILAILAAQKGAKTVDAIDIDEWAYENCMENAVLNGTQKTVNPIHGDATSIGKNYQFILANINRNILLRDMPTYVNAMLPGAHLIISGILEMDIPTINQKAENLGLKPTKTKIREGWAAIKFEKQTV